MNNTTWKTIAGGIITAIFIYSISSFLSIFTGAVAAMVQAASDVARSAGGDVSGLGFWTALDWICKLIVIGGYVMFFMNITKLAEAQITETEKNSMMTVRLGYILMVAQAIASMIPGVNAYGIIPCVISIFAYIKLLEGYKNLEAAETFSTTCRIGWGHLRHSIGMNIIAALITLPAQIMLESESAMVILGMLLYLISGILAVIAFTRMIAGWHIVKISGPYED